jgi:hypothetical protein
MHDAHNDKNLFLMMPESLKAAAQVYVSELEEPAARIATPAPLVTMPAALRERLAGARRPAPKVVRAGELWRVEPGALMWIDEVASGMLSGYLVHDRVEFAGPDDLIIDEDDSPTDEALALCMWRRLHLPLHDARGHLGALPATLRLAVVRAQRGRGELVDTDALGRAVWEYEEQGKLARWSTGAPWDADHDAARQLVRAAWERRSAPIAMAQRSTASRVMEAARALAAWIGGAPVTSGAAFPALEFGDEAMRSGGLADEASWAPALVEFSVSLGEISVALCFEELSGGRLRLTAQSLDDEAQPVANVVIALQAHDAALEITTDADGLAEGEIVAETTDAMLTLSFGELTRRLEL